MKYRSKPATCEAEQYLGPVSVTAAKKPARDDKFIEVPPFPDSIPEGVFWSQKNGGDYFPTVMTTHGCPVTIVPGDYVILEPDGNGHYPCKPEIFEKRWEPDL